MDRPPVRGRARARGRAQVTVDPTSEVAQPGQPSQSTSTAGSLVQIPQEEETVYTHMFVEEGRRLSGGSNGSSAENGSSGNGKNGGSNGDNGSTRGRGSPLESRGGSPRGLSPRAQDTFREPVSSEYLFTRPSADFLKTVPPTGHKTISIVSNYYPIRTHPQWDMSLYSISVEPNVDEESKAKKLLFVQKPNIGSYIKAGNQLFTTRPIKPEYEVFQALLDDVSYTVTLKYLRKVLESDPIVIQFYNTVVRQIQRMMEYELIGRHYFNPKEPIDFKNWGLTLWPGFQNSIRQQEKQMMLNVESVWKVLQTDSILTLMTNIRRQNHDNWQEVCKRDIVGMMVITTYNNRAYKITRIDFAATPEHSFSKADGSTITYSNYFMDRYKKNILDKRQPMLVSEPKLRDQRRGQIGDIYLVPELCYPCGLNDTLRGNFRLMKDIASCLHMPPTERVNTMNKFILGTTQNSKITEVLRNWGIKLPAQPVEFNARMLTGEQIVMAGGATIKPDDKADWTMGLRGKRMLTSMSLKNWAIVVTNRDSANIGELVNIMQKVGTPLGYAISRPAIIKKNDARGLAEGVSDAIKEFNGKTDMIMIILANNNADIYAAVKKRCSIEYGVPSQCFLSKNVTAKGLMSIATKVVIQMNAKQGGEPWGVPNVLKDYNLMVLGYDVHHAGPKGGSSIGAMTATVTPTLGSYFSCIAKTPVDRNEVATCVASLFEKCLKAYGQRNGKLPDNIIMYRDGVGEGQLPDVHRLEISAFETRIQTMYDLKHQNLPKLSFIVVNKRISTRFFQKVGNDRYDNPKPGLIVDDVVTRPERYDFFLLSQTARQGCVSPTYYNVLKHGVSLNPDQLQKFTYKMCHMYFNWSGTVSVPAPCQNAHKLAFLAGTALKRPAHSSLAYYLHFL